LDGIEHRTNERSRGYGGAVVERDREGAAAVGEACENQAARRLQIAVVMVVGVLVLFGFYLAHIPPPAGLGSIQAN